MIVVEPLLLHGAAVVDGHGVEFEVEFVGKVEGDLFRPLGLDDPFVLAEDGVFKLLEDGVRLVEVVVTADDAVAGTAIFGNRLGDEEVDHPFTAAPAEA